MSLSQKLKDTANRLAVIGYPVNAEWVEEAAAIIEAAEAWAKALGACEPSSFARSMAMAEAEENLLAALAAHGPSQETT